MYRFIDLVLCTIGVIIISPLLVIIITILRFTGEKEIFFKQIRIGKSYEEFGLYKFATMLKESPNIGSGTVTIKDDPRVLPFGKFLRKTKLNEIPQLFNVINGDMSLVGPRPQAPRNFRSFPDEYKEILVSVKPGLTGLGSIIFRSEENILNNSQVDNFYDTVIMPYKAQVEKYFVENFDIKNYFKIIFLTVVVISTNRTSIVRFFFQDLPKLPSELDNLI